MGFLQFLFTKRLLLVSINTSFHPNSIYFSLPSSIFYLSNISKDKAQPKISIKIKNLLSNLKKKKQLSFGLQLSSKSYQISASTFLNKQKSLKLCFLLKVGYLFFFKLNFIRFFLNIFRFFYYRSILIRHLFLNHE